MLSKLKLFFPIQWHDLSMFGHPCFLFHHSHYQKSFLMFSDSERIDSFVFAHTSFQILTDLGFVFGRQVFNAVKIALVSLFQAFQLFRNLVLYFIYFFSLWAKILVFAFSLLPPSRSLLLLNFSPIPIFFLPMLTVFYSFICILFKICTQYK